MALHTMVFAIIASLRQTDYFFWLSSFVKSPHTAATLDTGIAVPALHQRQSLKDGKLKKWQRQMPSQVNGSHYLSDSISRIHKNISKIYIANRNKIQDRIYVEELPPHSQSYRLLVTLPPGKQCLSQTFIRFQTVNRDFF